MKMRFRRTLSGDLSAVRVVFGKRPVTGRRSFEIATLVTSAVLFVFIGAGCSIAHETVDSRADASVVDSGFGADADGMIDATVAVDALFTSSWTGGGLTFEYVQFEYVQPDEMGRIRKLHETSDAMPPREYEYFYDDAGRLTDVRLEDVLVGHYGYDANGNR